jgi:hypothetical protein
MTPDERKAIIERGTQEEFVSLHSIYCECELCLAFKERRKEELRVRANG